MKNPIREAKQEISELILTAVRTAISEGALPEAETPEFTVEIPNDTAHGDFASNAAMVSARAFKKPPRQIAEVIAARLPLEGTRFERVEIAGPGFLNFFASGRWFADAAAGVLREGPEYGRTDYGKGKKVMVEFVSANPTGPMHMGNARGGAIGDGLAAALDAAGYEVAREFYINDAGNQIEKFGVSLEARYLQHFKGEEAVPFPEDGYHGTDITERSEEYIALHGDKLLAAEPAERRRALVEYALPKNVEKLRSDLLRYRISFDNWFPESSLHESGAVKAAIDALSARGATYEKDGAVWYKATAFGGEKDEVLVRANGFPTYFAADIAYHYNKLVTRGYDLAIDVWGADHHGHVARLKGAMEAVGVEKERLDIVLMQLVRLMKNGEPFKMSKRTGKAVTLGDLLEEIPIDAARFFFNMREPSSTLDFDLDLAVEQSSQNPVYYVQYAHARICSIFKNLAAEGITRREVSEEELCLLTDGSERELIRQLALLPEEIIAAAKNYDPARLTHYVIELATRFHRFYNTCRCKVEDESLMQARLALCDAVRIVLRNVLSMLKIDTPEAM